MRNVHDLWQTEKLFGDHLKAWSIFFGQWWASDFFSAKDLSRLHQFGKKVYLEYSSGMRWWREEFGKENSGPQTLKNWKTWTRQKSILEESVEKKQ